MLERMKDAFKAVESFDDIYRSSLGAFEVLQQKVLQKL
jgi:hypothetical protein